MSTHIRRGATAVAAVSLLLAGCATTSPEPTTAEEAGATPEETPADEITVVVTTSVLGDLARQVLGDAGATIEVLMGPGVDPHGYAPSAADGLRLREADLVIANGLQLEESLVDTLEAAEEDGVRVLRVAEQVDPIEYQAGADQHADADEDEHVDEDEHADEGGLDPHVWLDPIRAAQIAELIAEAYAEVAPGAAEAVTAAAADVSAEFTALDAELRERLDVLPDVRRRLITNHDAVGYFAARYDLEVIATVLPGTAAGVDVTASGFSDLVELLRETGIPAVFAENTASDRLASALADEVDGVVVSELYTDSIGEPGSGADTLQGMLRTNAERIVDALG